MPNLTARNFTLYQEGVKQNIEFFAATEKPLNVALLFDTSHSSREVLDDIKESALDFVKLLQPQYRAMIVSFDYQTRFLSASRRSRLLLPLTKAGNLSGIADPDFNSLWRSVC